MSFDAARSSPRSAQSGAILGGRPTTCWTYPTELVERVGWNNETIVIRPIRGEDEPQFHEFVDRLRPEDLRLRFFGVPRELTHQELVRLTQVDFAREMALVAVRTLADGNAEVLGVVRAVTEPNRTDAELGIIVRSDLKSRGLGWLLLRKLIDSLPGRGLERLVAYVLHENLAMQQLAFGNGFVIDAAASDAQALCFVLGLLDPEPPSLGPSKAIAEEKS